MVGTGPLSWNQTSESVYQPKVTTPLDPMDLPDAVKFDSPESDFTVGTLTSDAMKTMESGGSGNAQATLELYTESENIVDDNFLEGSIFARSMRGHFDLDQTQRMVADLSDYDTAKLANVFSKAGAHSAAHLLINSNMENQYLTSNVYTPIHKSSLFSSDDLISPEPQTTDQPYLNMIKRFNQFSPAMAKGDLKLLQHALLNARVSLENNGQIDVNALDLKLLNQYGLGVENNLLVVLDDEQGSLKLSMSEVSELLDSLDIMINADEPLQRILIAKAHALEQQNELEDANLELEINTGKLEVSLQSGDIIKSEIEALDESMVLLGQNSSSEAAVNAIVAAGADIVTSTITGLMADNNMEVQQSSEGASFWIFDNQVEKETFFGKLSGLVQVERDLKKQEYDSHLEEVNELRLGVIKQTETVSLAYERFTRARKELETTIQTERPKLSERERRFLNESLIPVLAREMNRTEASVKANIDKVVMAFFGTDVNGIATDQFLKYMDDQMKADKRQMDLEFDQFIEETRSGELPESSTSGIPVTDSDSNEEYKKQIDEWADQNTQAFNQRVSRRAKRQMEDQLQDTRLTQANLDRQRNEQNQVVENHAKDRERFIRENTIREQESV